MSPVHIIVILACVLIIGALQWFVKQSVFNSHITKWALERGFRVMSVDRTGRRRGPYNRGTSRNQGVFLVKVLDETGEPRRYWLRVGSTMLGFLSGQIEEFRDDSDESM